MISSSLTNAGSTIKKDWIARWICDRRFLDLIPVNVFHKQFSTAEPIQHRDDLKNNHMLVRRKFSVEKGLKSAYIDISADDYYKLYINGKFVAQGPAPGYHFHYNFNRHEISRYLITGENVIAVHVYYQGLVNRVWNSGDYRQGMIAELFADDVFCLGTDRTWKYTVAKEFTSLETTGYETQFIEDIDQRLKEKSWNKLLYDDMHWEQACEKLSDDHKLVMQDTPTVDVYEVKPVSIEQIENGNYIIDFGHELTGCFKMEVLGNAGQLVEIKYGEEMETQSGGQKSVRYNMRCNCNYCDSWILSGTVDVLEQFDYKAFRYVEISGLSQTVKVDTESFCAVVRHYPMDETKCDFASSDGLLNDIWNICRNAVKCGSQEAFLDCPSREKGQYLGDATITAHSHLYLSGDLRLFKKSIEDSARTAFICPGLMAVAPGSFMQEIADYSLQWPLQLLSYYWQSGDIDFVREMYPVAKGILGYFAAYKRSDGLLVNVIEKRNLVDWPENLRDDYDFDLSERVGNGCHNVINAFYCGAVKTVNELEKILGYEQTEDYNGLVESFISAFYREKAGVFADSEVSQHTSLHSNIIPLFYGFAPEKSRDGIIKMIRQKRLNCGVYNSYFLLKGLAGAGEHKLLFELMTSQDEHSWGNMLKEGATSCFEAWGKEQKWNTSLCHPWASAPVPVIIEDIIGLKPGKPGWKEYCFEPHIPEELEEFDIKISTINGIIQISYRDKDFTVITNIKKTEKSI